MMRQWMRRLAMALAACLMASVLWAGAFVVSERMSARAEESLPGISELTFIDLADAAQSFAFEPSANGLYSVWMFPQDDTARATVTVESANGLLAEGEGAMRLLSVRLTAGESVTLHVSGTGTGRIEVTRDALSRSFGMPLELNDGAGYSKLIARSRDAHWYSFTANHSGACILAAAPDQGGLEMQMYLLSAGGAVIGESENLPSGTAVVSAELSGGETYFVRVAAKNGETGKYYLSSLRSASAGRAENVAFTSSALSIEGRSFAEADAILSPAGAAPLVFFDSSDPAVAAAMNGVVEGRMPGTAVVTAYAYGGARAQCEVEVRKVDAESVHFDAETLSIAAGDSHAMKTVVLPDNASDQRVTYMSDDESVVTVDSRGKITALREGEARVVVLTEDGGWTDVVIVTVTEPERRYRALLIGEQNYASTVDKVRTGSINSVESIAGLLKSFGGTEYQVATLMDAPRDSVIAGIRETFAGATEKDVSLIYITCHGFYEAGMTFFVMADGSVLSARDLERELRNIPGEIVLMADCCGSGGLIGESGSADDLLKGITSVFQGVEGSASIYGSRYRVMASALLDQDSYRISFSGSGEDGMATVFARALCDAAGWSMDRDARSAMNADTDYDGEITLTELGAYMSRRVSWYLSLVGDYAQSVCVYPEGDNFALFSNISEE